MYLNFKEFERVPMRFSSAARLGCMDCQSVLLCQVGVCATAFHGSCCFLQRAASSTG